MIKSHKQIKFIKIKRFIYMITTRLNILVSILVILIAMSSLAFNYSLIYNNKKNHLENDMKNYARNTIEKINKLHAEKVVISDEKLKEITKEDLYMNDVNLFSAFVDSQKKLISSTNLPQNISLLKYIENNDGFTHHYEDGENLFMITGILTDRQIYLFYGYSKQELRASLFTENLYISLWVAFCILIYIGFIVYYTRAKIDKPLKNLFDSSLREFVNGILASNTDCKKMKAIDNIMLPEELKSKIRNTFGMLQKWSCYKIHFDEFLKMTVAESDKGQLINNLFIAVEDDFFVKELTVLEINHSLNRFEPITISANNVGEDYHENLLSNPLECLAYRTGNRVLLDNSKKLACSTCAYSIDETIICKPMMSSGKQTGVIKFKLDNNKLNNSEDINGSMESRVRFLESYLKSYIDLTSLTISNINLLNAYKNQALTDPLTNLYNRRYITEYLFGLLNLAKRKESPLSVFMIDIDNFKRFNDEYGHKVGDIVLQIVARTIEKSVREGDTVARYGGEEFIAVLPYSDIDIAFEVGERVRESVEKIEWSEYELPNVHPVTISLGIAAYPIHGYSHYHLTNAADKALYRAKRSGRNRVVVHEIKEREAKELETKEIA